MKTIQKFRKDFKKMKEDSLICEVLDSNGNTIYANEYKEKYLRNPDEYIIELFVVNKKKSNLERTKVASISLVNIEEIGSVLVDDSITN